METTILKTDLHCNNCIKKVEPILKSDGNIKNYQFDLDHPDKLIKIESSNLNLDFILSQINDLGYSATKMVTKRSIKFQNLDVKGFGFWSNNSNWKRASFNTINCLIGCSIGDFGMIFYLQAYYPNTSMFWQMILAIIAGLITSIILETIILRKREKFDWTLALKTAFSMSFISMIGMEIAMNTTDFMITGGKAAFNTVQYWLALIPALVAGFVFPLPYNYYKLQKFNKACH
jgi:cation transport ATPase